MGSTALSLGGNKVCCVLPPPPPPPPPAYYLKLDSIYCWAKNDAVGYDEPRLYVDGNGNGVWSHEHFDRDQSASLTHIPRIRFNDTVIGVRLDEHDDWPGSTITIPSLTGDAISAPESDLGVLYGHDFVRGDFRTWYTLYYIVVYEYLAPDLRPTVVQERDLDAIAYGSQPQLRSPRGRNEPNASRCRLLSRVGIAQRAVSLSLTRCRDPASA